MTRKHWIRLIAALAVAEAVPIAAAVLSGPPEGMDMGLWIGVWQFATMPLAALLGVAAASLCGREEAE